jgi:hypothetical protein
VADSEIVTRSCVTVAADPAVSLNVRFAVILYRTVLPATSGVATSGAGWTETAIWAPEGDGGAGVGELS